MVDALIQRLGQQALEVAGLSSAGTAEDDVLSASQASLLDRTGAVSSGSMTNTAQLIPEDGEGLTSFTAPLCDLFVELFELKAANNWLRRQAVLIILQQVLGGTIERKLRDGIRAACSPENLVNYLNILRDNLFPNGCLKPPEPLRSPGRKAATRESANRKLSAVMPALAENVLGRSNARQAGRIIFAILQNSRLNRHILYTVVDDVIDALFPELQSKP